jgi:adenylate cyclase
VAGLNLIQGPGGDTCVEPKAMDVLVCLSQQAGEVVPKERLMQTVWADTFVTDEVLTNSIWELRKAFRDDAKNPKGHSNRLQERLPTDRSGFIRH